MDMMDREQLETFATIVEVQSFEKAAAVLNISRGAVSQRIKALEEALSTVLIVRDKPVAPTARGEIVLRHVQALRLLEDASLAELRPGADRAPVLLAIAVNADSLATWFPNVLWPLLKENRVALEVVTDDQDHTLVCLARGEVIGCISTEEKPATGFVAEPLGTMEYRCYATHAFAAHHFPQGLSVQAALRAPAVLFNRKDSLHDDFLKDLFGFAVEKYTRHYLPAPVTLLEGITAGIGYGLVPSVQVVGPYADQLIELAPGKPVDVALYWHHWAAEPPLSQAITKLVLEQASRHLVQLSSGRSRPYASQVDATAINEENQA
jgi:LysR family transcriptional regulator, chromosome initiation inhibitor